MLKFLGFIALVSGNENMLAVVVVLWILFGR